MRRNANRRKRFHLLDRDVDHVVQTARSFFERIVFLENRADLFEVSPILRRHQKSAEGRVVAVELPEKLGVAAGSAHERKEKLLLHSDVPQ